MPWPKSKVSFDVEIAKKDTPNTRLFLLYDDCEQFLVAARDREHLWQRVSQELGDDAANELVTSHVDEYPESFATPILERHPDCLIHTRPHSLKTPVQVREELAIDQIWRV